MTIRPRFSFWCSTLLLAGSCLVTGMIAAAIAIVLLDNPNPSPWLLLSLALSLATSVTGAVVACIILSRHAVAMRARSVWIDANGDLDNSDT